MCGERVLCQAGKIVASPVPHSRSCMPLRYVRSETVREVYAPEMSNQQKFQKNSRLSNRFRYRQHAVPCMPCRLGQRPLQSTARARYPNPRPPHYCLRQLQLVECPAFFVPVEMRETGTRGASMARGKKHTAEQIVNLLRQVEVAVANGKTTAAGVQGSRDRRADVLPLAQGVRRVAGGPGAAAEGAGAGEREAEAVGSGAEPGEAGVEGHRLGKLLSPERRRCAVSHAQRSMG